MRGLCQEAQVLHSSRRRAGSTAAASRLSGVIPEHWPRRRLSLTERLRPSTRAFGSPRRPPDRMEALRRRFARRMIHNFHGFHSRLHRSAAGHIDTGPHPQGQPDHRAQANTPCGSRGPQENGEPPQGGSLFGKATHATLLRHGGNTGKVTDSVERTLAHGSVA